MFRLAPELFAARGAAGRVAVVGAARRRPEQIQPHWIVGKNALRPAADFGDVGAGPFEVRHAFGMIGPDRLDRQLPVIVAAAVVCDPGFLECGDLAGDAPAAAAKKIDESEFFHFFNPSLMLPMIDDFAAYPCDTFRISVPSYSFRTNPAKRLLHKTMNFSLGKRFLKHKISPL